MPATNMKFSIQPDSIEPVLCIWFDYVHGQEINDQEVYWARDKLIMAKEFEDAIRASLQLDFHSLFELLYSNSIEDVPFFEQLESQLNLAGFYTYNSDTTFDVFSADSVDLTDQDVLLCLES